LCFQSKDSPSKCSPSLTKMRLSVFRQLARCSSFWVKTPWPTGRLAEACCAAHHDSKVTITVGGRPRPSAPCAAAQTRCRPNRPRRRMTPTAVPARMPRGRRHPMPRDRPRWRRCRRARRAQAAGRRPRLTENFSVLAIMRNGR
jgi:hypothetical protein